MTGVGGGAGWRLAAESSKLCLKTCAISFWNGDARRVSVFGKIRMLSMHLRKVRTSLTALETNVLTESMLRADGRLGV